MSGGPILLCAATAMEVKACKKGVRGNDRFEILRTGMGRASAKKALTQRLADLPKPSWIISTGFAGSLTTECEIGAWISGKSVCLGDREMFRVEGLPSFFPSFKACDFITVDQVENQSRILDKVVDMESSALAALSNEHQIPFGILRLISDSPSSPMPIAISHFAEIAAQKSPSAQVRSAMAGLAESLLHPKKLAGFVMRSAQLTGVLQRDWTRFAELESSFALESKARE